MSNSVRLTFFGPPRIEVDGAPVATDRRKAIALLAYLAVTGRAQARTLLAAMLWPDYADAGAYLRRTLWELRELLGPGWVDGDRERVEFHPAGELWVDVYAFRRAASGPHTDALAQAVDLAQDDFLAGFTVRDAPAFEEWQRLEAETLRRELAGALERLAWELAARSDLRAALAHAHRLLALDPLHEPAHRLLMRLYVQAGDRAAALRQFETCAETLRRELGAGPEPETVVLAEEIRRGDLRAAPTVVPAVMPAVMPAAAPSAAAPATLPPAAAPNNLPALATAFMGRRAELDAVGRLLADPACRLLTLTGPGGVGKSRLALQAAQDNLAAFPDGVWFVPLAPLNQPAEVAQAVARALELPGAVREQGDLPALLAEYLRSKRALLVLDNWEHLLEDGPPSLPGLLLTRAPGLKLLTTSRVRLNVAGEHLLPVLGLSLPAAEAPDGSGAPAQDDALRLFEQRAQSVAPDFALTPANRAAVTRVCRLVSGFPLGIELAASWAELLPPGEIAAEVEKCLDFLASEGGDPSDRHRSLRAVFESSWALLSPAEQEAYRRLSVFRHPFTRAAAESVAGASLRMLQALVHKSLVYRVTEDRYVLHELLRQFAFDRLQADAAGALAVHARHSDYYLGRLAEQAPRMRGPEQKEAFDAVAVEAETVRAAWLWAVEHGNYAAAGAALDALNVYHQARSWWQEFHTLLERGRALLPEQGPRPAQILRAQINAFDALYADGLWGFWGPDAELFRFLRDWDTAVGGALLREARAILDRLDGWDEAGGGATMSLGFMWFWLIDREEGVVLLDDAVARLRAAGDDRLLSAALHLLGVILPSMHRLDEGEVVAHEAVTVALRTGDRLQLARNLQLLGTIKGIGGDDAAYAEANQRALAHFHAVGALLEEGRTLEALAFVADDQGDYAEAVRLYGAGRQLAARTGDVTAERAIAGWESIDAVRLGDFNYARTMRLHALAISTARRDPVMQMWDYWELGELERSAGNLEAARAAWREAKALLDAYDQRSALPLYHRGLGDLAYTEGDIALSAAEFARSLEAAREQRHDWSECYARAGLARAAAVAGDVEAAWVHVRAAFATRLRTVRGLMLTAVCALAEVLWAAGDAAGALEVAAFAAAERATWAEQRPRMAALAAQAEAMLPTEVAAAAHARAAALSVDVIVARYAA